MGSPIVITGTVAADARAQRTRDGDSVLTVDLTPPNTTARRPAVVRIVKRYGSGEAAAYACKAHALRLRRGVRVVASGQGLHPVRGALVLQGVDDIHEPDLVLRAVTGERPEA